jgi:hypothetical protein
MKQDINHEKLLQIRLKAYEMVMSRIEWRFAKQLKEEKKPQQWGTTDNAEISEKNILLISEIKS